ncbi:MAG: N-acyl homoserine lactonase family protein [Lapillicoccus sp.]
MPDNAVLRLGLGWFVRPAEETGTGSPRVEPCLAYAVRLDPAVGGYLLFDTGMGSDDEVDAHYRPQRQPLREALAAHGIRLDEVTHVTNCHLHFDHCGGNPLLPGRPVFVQRRELEAARTIVDYTLPRLVEDDHHVVLDGEAQILPGLHLIPTPGHTDGHQSLVVEQTNGSIVVAGQSHDTASAWSADVLARRSVAEGAAPPLPTTPAWLERIAEFDPRRVVFAHDHAVWEP